MNILLLITTILALMNSYSNYQLMKAQKGYTDYWYNEHQAIKKDYFKLLKK